MTAQKDKERTRIPLLVRLFRGEAHDLVQVRFAHILGGMWQDPVLDVGPAAIGLLATAFGLLLRPNLYREGACRLAGLSRRWSPDTYLTAIMEFLREPERNLDV